MLGFFAAEQATESHPGSKWQNFYHRCDVSFGFGLHTGLCWIDSLSVSSLSQVSSKALSLFSDDSLTISRSSSELSLFMLAELQRIVVACKAMSQESINTCARIRFVLFAMSHLT